MSICMFAITIFGGNRRRPAKRRVTKGDLEDELADQIKKYGLPLPVRQYRLTEHRRFKYDFAWPDRAIVVDVQGGTFIRGAHTRGKGYQRDCDKHNLAIWLGFRPLLFTAQDVKRWKAVQLLRKILYGEK